MTRLLTAVSAIFLSTGMAMAHEGHGHTASGQGNSVWHYLTEPQHAWVFAAVVTVGVGVMLFGSLQKQTQED